jgi:hypothetical protein
MAKKTFKVEDLKDMVNRVLLESNDKYGASPALRQGMMNVLEQVLHETGNYGGFKHLRPSQVPFGNIPGIVVECVDGTTIDERFPEGKVDRTRVHYF